MRDVFGRLTLSTLADLALSLRQGALHSGISSRPLEQIAGADQSEEIAEFLSELVAQGWRTEQMAVLFDVVHETRATTPRPEKLLDLVISGPEVNGVPTRDTLAVMQSLIADAQREVILIGYAVHNGRKLFAPLARRMEGDPSLDVWICLNLFRDVNNSDSAAATVERFMQRFYEENWPWEVRPRIYYDTRGIKDESTQASLHAKCLICDRERALISSANFTEAAQKRNIEAGILVSHPATVGRLAGYFDGLKQAGVLKKMDSMKGGLDGGI